MSKRVGVIGIDLKRLKGEFGSKALSFSGNNFGNMLFTNAVYNQIPNCSHLGFSFDPKVASDNFDHIIIPASNWVNKKEDWGFLAEQLEKTNLPITIVGLGSQLDRVEDVFDIAEGTKRFLRLLSERGPRIAVRGEFTKEALNLLGFDNVIALGCPSIFNKLTIPNLRLNFRRNNLRLGIGPTRYNLAQKYDKLVTDKQRQLYQYAIHNASSIYYQSESFEIAYLNREDVDQQVDACLQYYGLESEEQFYNNIMQRGKYHKDLDQWLADSVKDDLYIGTRIHGAVSSILAGTPAILLTHDNRTQELADIMGIPNMELDKFEIKNLDNIRDFIELFDFDKIKMSCDKNIRLFVSYYESAGLEVNIKNP